MFLNAPHLGWPDVALALVVTGQTLLLAYLHSPRAKSLVYMIPLPFSTALVATGRGVDLTHVVGMAAVWAFVWVVWWLYARRGVRIVAADLLAIVAYCAVGFALARLLPHGLGVRSPWFWTGLAAVALAAGAALFLPHPPEPGHRSALSPWVKAPVVLGLVFFLICTKNALRGFMPAFPMVSVFAVYEARHSLRTLAQRFPIFVLAWTAMALLLALLLPPGPALPPRAYLLPLAAAWALFLPLQFLLERWYTRRG